MEKEPILEKKKKPLEKRMEDLKKKGIFADKYKDEEWNQCQTCFSRADWFIEGNSYCSKCMLEKVEEFEQLVKE